MKRYILYIGILLCTLMSCADKDWEKDSWVSDQEVWATLQFGHASFEKIDISTRATLNEIAESRVETCSSMCSMHKGTGFIRISMTIPIEWTIFLMWQETGGR